MVAAVAMLFSGGAYAFTASNTVPTTTAGNGNNTISGYTVSGVTYALSNAADGGTAASPVITAVSFTLSSAATAANVSAVISGVSTSASYPTCTNSGSSSTGEFTGGTWTCSLSTGSTAAESVNNATSLVVTAAQ